MEINTFESALDDNQPSEKMTQITIQGDINPSQYAQYHAQLSPFVNNNDRHRVLINICSLGGSIHTSFLLCDIFNAWPAEKACIAGGLNASAATFIISQCNLRLAYPHARFMFHDIAHSMKGSSSEFDETARYLKDVRTDITGLYQDHIGLTKKEADRILNGRNYYNAQHALELGTKGLIDGIIVKLLPGFRYEIIMRGGVRKVVNLACDDFNDIRNLTVDAIKNPALIEVNKK